MKQNKFERISDLLSEKYGLPISVTESIDRSAGTIITLTPGGLHPNEGFHVRMNLGWRRIELSLVMGSFSGPLIEKFSEASAEMRANFCLLAKKHLDEGAQMTLKINDSSCNVSDSKSWPVEKWARFELKVSKSPLVYDEKNQDEVETLISNWGGKFLGCILCLSPLENAVEVVEEMVHEGLPEGARITVTANRYERSPFNRATCIDYHGLACKACGFDFKKQYGSLGNDFIIVHHIVPVSKMGGSYKINPITDLVPVCPNCHYMLHKTDPPLSVEELAQILEKNKKSDN